jgi:hypothetical protein
MVKLALIAHSCLSRIGDAERSFLQSESKLIFRKTAWGE